MQRKRSFQNEILQLHLIAGIESSTIQNLQMVHDPLDKLGISKTILNPINSYVGDGIVMVHSVFALDGDKYMVKGGHMEVLFRSYSILQRKLA